MDRDGVNKLPKLTGADDFINWRRRVKAYLQQQDIDLLGLTDRPDAGSTTQNRRWLEFNVKAKSAITLTLSDGPLAQVSTIVDDDDKTAKDLWTELDKAYRMSNTQMVINIQRDLETMTFDRDEEWDKHIEKFHHLVAKLASYDSPLSAEDKVSKLLRTLPTRFAPIAMVAEASGVPFERVIASVKAEISRRNKQDSGRPIPHVAAAASHDNNPKGRSIYRGRISKNKRDVCFVCGRPGHFANKCWFRNNTTRGGRGRGRDRGRQFVRGGRGRGLAPNYNWQDHTQSHPASQGSWGIRQQQDENPPSGPSGSESITPSVNTQSYRASTGPNNPPFQGGFMAKLKFRTTIATTDRTKPDQCLIDSGGTHHFLFARSSFSSYEKIDKQSVKSASGLSIVVGKGLVKLPFDNGPLVEAYHTPQFATNILSVGILSSRYNVLFTCDPPAKDGVSTCILTRRVDGNVALTVPIEDGLFSIKMDERPTRSSHSHQMAVCTSCKQSSHGGHVTSDNNLAMEWHKKLGHISAERLFETIKVYPAVPDFSMRTLNDIFCPDCQIAKAKRAPVQKSNRITTRALELVHMDVLGPMRMKSLGGRSYVLGIVDDFTAYSDIFVLSKRSQVYDALCEYIGRTERTTGLSLQSIRLDGAGEHKGEIVTVLQRMHGINLEWSPPYAPQSNGRAERLMQELSLRARVMLTNTDLPDQLWAEAMHHGNWLRNRLPSKAIENDVPIGRMRPNANVVDFSTIPIFGQLGFAFVYRPSTTANRKLLARAIHVIFVGMESDERLCRTYDPQEKSIYVVRLSDFKACRRDQLPPISTMLDGLARQAEEEHGTDVDGYAEEGLQQALSVAMSSFGASGNLKDPKLPTDFTDAVRHKAWRDAIDREYSALRKRNTWTYVRRTSDMNVLPITWVFRLKHLDHNGRDVLHKARCCVRGDYQVEDVDFDPSGTHAPVASHEAVRILFAHAASNDLIVEGGDVANAYLYGKIDCHVYIEQPTDSTGKEHAPGHVCVLMKSMYGIRQAGRIWGSLLVEKLDLWGFKHSTTDERLLFLSVGSSFVLLVIVVDDLAFSSNSPELLADFKDRLSATFDVKFFGELKSFIGWDIQQGPDGLSVCQGRYIDELLKNHGMDACNATLTPMSTEVDLRPATESEDALRRIDHRLYRKHIGQLLYLSICTRPDISFAVCALARSLHAPTDRHRTMLRRVLRYLSASKNLGLKFTRTTADLKIKAYSDSDWAGCKGTRQSTTGFLITANGTPISWKSIRQSIVALSSAEAEYISLSTTAKELTWVRRLCWEVKFQRPFGVQSLIPTITVFSDNTAAIAISDQDGLNARTKHIAVRYHHVRNLRSDSVICIQHIPTLDQVADLLTKPVTRQVMERLRPSMLVDVGRHFDD